MTTVRKITAIFLASLCVICLSILVFCAVSTAALGYYGFIAAETKVSIVDDRVKHVQNHYPELQLVAIDENHSDHTIWLFDNAYETIKSYKRAEGFAEYLGASDAVIYELSLAPAVMLEKLVVALIALGILIIIFLLVVLIIRFMSDIRNFLYNNYVSELLRSGKRIVLKYIGSSVLSAAVVLAILYYLQLSPLISAAPGNAFTKLWRGVSGAGIFPPNMVTGLRLNALSNISLLVFILSVIGFGLIAGKTWKNSFERR